MGFDDSFKRVKKLAHFKLKKNLAEFLGVDPTTLSRYRAKNKFNWEWAEKIAQAHKDQGITTEWIMTGEGPTPHALQASEDEGSAVAVAEAPEPQASSALEEHRDKQTTEFKGHGDFNKKLYGDSLPQIVAYFCEDFHPWRDPKIYPYVQKIILEAISLAVAWKHGITFKEWEIWKMHGVKPEKKVKEKEEKEKVEAN